MTALLEFYHHIGDADCARARRSINGGGLAPLLRIRNLHYDNIEADFRAHGGSAIPAVWDGQQLHSGIAPVLAFLRGLPPNLHSDRLWLRPGSEADVDALFALVSTPAVSEFWPGYTRERMRSDLLDKDAGRSAFVIEHASQVVGYIQFVEELDPDHRHAGIDLFVGAAWQGRGLGKEAIRRIADYLFDTADHHRLVIDPAAHNARAIAAYTACGFRPIGRMRQYARGTDGDWHDGLLMDLLRSERG